VKKFLLLASSHVMAIIAGFALGVYMLPILTAPASPSAVELAAQTGQVVYTGEFRRDLQDSDALHWGEGTVTLGTNSIVFMGKLAPGPDYKLYLSPEFVETEADFMRLKERMARVGDVKTFENFIVPLPESVDVNNYSAVIVWCESFAQFITAASYR
jgi:hypothetical protein